MNIVLYYNVNVTFQVKFTGTQNKHIKPLHKDNVSSGSYILDSPTMLSIDINHVVLHRLLETGGRG